MATTAASLSGRVALVTGGSRGIGAAIAQRLARAGAEVVITFLKSQQLAIRVVAAVNADGGSAEARQADIRDEAQMARLVSDLQREGRPVDILVNCAGAILRPAGWREQTSEDIRSSVDLNFVAHVLLSRLVAPSMMKKRYGRIVNISSTYGITGAAPVLAYTCAKSALITLTYALARELGPHGVTVNCVAPGNIDTDMTRAAGEEVMKWAIGTTPVGRLGEPDEVASAVEFLVTSPFVNGALLVMDGGQILNM